MLLQTAIIEFGALEPLARLLVEAQPDGQYSAAALLNNLAAAGPGTSNAILAYNPLPAIAAMLNANSWYHTSLFHILLCNSVWPVGSTGRCWDRSSPGREIFLLFQNQKPTLHVCRYCRIVAADLLAHLFSHQPSGKTTGALSGTYESLLALLCLQEMREEEIQSGNCVAHVAYERSHDVIVMKGYPFLRAKVVAANALGVMLALDRGPPAIATASLALLGNQLQAMLSLGSDHVRLVAIAAIIDVAQTSEAAREILAQVGILLRTFSMK